MPPENLQTKKNKLSSQVRQQIVGYIVAALSLVAGLAWNDAVKSIIEHFFYANSNSLWAKVIYAFLLSVLVALVSYFLLRFTITDEKKS